MHLYEQIRELFKKHQKTALLIFLLTLSLSFCLVFWRMHIYKETQEKRAEFVADLHASKQYMYSRRTRQVLGDCAGASKIIPGIQRAETGWQIRYCVSIKIL